MTLVDLSRLKMAQILTRAGLASARITLSHFGTLVRVGKRRWPRRLRTNAFPYVGLSALQTTTTAS
jgi:hypothetical protein